MRAREAVTIRYERQPDGSWQLYGIDEPEQFTRAQHDALESSAIAVQEQLNAIDGRDVAA